MGKLQITMDGKQASQLCKDLDVDVLVTIHYQGWRLYTQNKDDSIREFEDECIMEKVCWLPGDGLAKVLI